jgi:hypothetical protein
MNLSELARERLTNQQLTKTRIKSAVEMVKFFCAIQGQEYAQTKWGIGLRLSKVKDIHIESDLNEGSILRTHLLRPTWHFVAADDIHWILELTAKQVHKVNSYMYRKLELDTKTLNTCNDIIIKNLMGGKQRTRNELNEYFKRENIIAQGHRLSYIMMYAELEKIICSGARRGNQFTYALFDERVKKSETIEYAEALGRLALQYFTSRGPATVNDFSTWSGLNLTECKKGIAIIADQLETIIVDDITYFMSKDTIFSNKFESSIYLLPIYDEYIMGYKDRSAILAYKKALKNAPLFKYDCMIIFAGQIIGTWKRTMKNPAASSGVSHTPRTCLRVVKWKFILLAVFIPDLRMLHNSHSQKNSTAASRGV